MQDAFAIATKKTFPRAKMLIYTITGAVPYDMVVQNAIVEHPELFIRWHNAPNNNGSVAQMPFVEARTGLPGDNCSFEVIASQFDFANPDVQLWWLENVIKKTMVVGDGTWIDGDGPDNGSW